MATLELNVSSNAQQVLPGVDRRIDVTTAKAEKLKKEFSTINFNKANFDINPSIKTGDLSIARNLLQSLVSDVAKFTVGAYTYFTSVNSSFEQLNIMLETATGSAEEGKKAFREMIDLSTKAPFSIDALTDTFIKLKSAGIKDAYEYTKVLADSISAFGGGSDKLKLVSVAIMQMAGKGVISMEELRRQFGEQVPTAIRIMEDELKKAGKIAEDVKITDVIKKGQLGAKTGIEALMKGLSEDYMGSSQKRMDSYKGSVQLLNTQIELLMWDIGQAKGSFSSISGAIEAGAQMVEKFRTSAEGMAVIEKIARGVADGFNKISENPEIIYQFFITVGDLAGSAAQAIQGIIVILNNLMSAFDMVSGKVSGSTFSLLPKDFKMEQYAKMRPMLEEMTKVQDKLKEYDVGVKADSFAKSPVTSTIGAIVDSLSFGLTKADAVESKKELKELQEQYQSLYATISSGGAQVKGMAEDQKQVSEETKTHTSRVKELVDLLGNKKQGANTAERKALTQLKAEMKNYVNEAKDVIEATKKWNSEAKDATEKIEKLNEELATSQMGEYERLMYDIQKSMKEGGKAADEYQKSLSEIEGKISGIKEQYAIVTEQVDKFRGKLTDNSAGSPAQDVNNIHQLISVQTDLQDQLKELTKTYDKLKDASSLSITTSEENAKAQAQAAKNRALTSAYGKIGVGSEDIYSVMIDGIKQEAKSFIEATGDKVLAHRVFSDQIREIERSRIEWMVYENSQYQNLILASIPQEIENVKKEAIKTYENVLPEAISKSSDAIGKFARDVAQSNKSISEAWDDLGKSISNVVFDILEELTRLAVKMTVLQSVQSVFGGESAVGSIFSSLLASKDGNVFSGISGLSSGVYTSPTVFGYNSHITGFASGGVLAEAGKPEGVLPLERIGNKLGVNAKMQNGGVNVIVNNNSSAKVQTETRENSEGGTDIIVELVENKIRERQNRGYQGFGRNLW